MLLLGDADPQTLRPVLGHSRHEGAEPAGRGGALGQTRSHLPAAAGVISSSCPAKRGRGTTLREQCGGRGMGLTDSVGAARSSTAALRFAVEEERLRRLVDLFAGEAGLGRITAHDRLALLE